MKKLIAIHFSLLCLKPLVFGQDLTALQDMIKEECKDKVGGFVLEFINCLQDHFGGDFQTVLQNPDKAGKAICDPNLRKCIFEYQARFKSCVKDENLLKFYDEQVKALIASLTYACKDDAKPLTDFLQDGKKCFGEKIDRCATLQELQSIIINNVFINFHFDQMCKLAGKLSLCLLDALDHCSTKAARNFIGGALWESLRSTTCKDIIDLEVPINVFYM